MEKIFTVDELQEFKAMMEREPSETDMLKAIDQLKTAKSVGESDQFDFNVFEGMLQASSRLCDMYRELGKDFKADLKSEERTTVALQSVAKWFKEYNMRDLTKLTEVTRTTVMAQTKVMVDSIELNLSGYKINEDYALISGVFTPIEVCVIPLDVVGYGKIPTGSNKETLGYLRELAIVLESDKVRGKLIPQDSVIGTMKVVGNSHVVLVVRDQPNPFSKGIWTIKNWRFIDRTGLSY